MPAERAEAVSPEALIQRVEELTAQVEQLPDPVARRTAEDLVSAVIEMYGQGLTRIVEILDEDGERRRGQAAVRRRRRRRQPHADP